MHTVELRYSLEIDPASIIEDLQSDIDPERVAGALLFMAPDIDAKQVCQHFDELFTFAGCTVNNSFCSERRGAVSGGMVHYPSTTSQTALIIYFLGSETLASGFLSSFPKSKSNFFCFTTNEAITREPLTKLKMIGGVASTSIDGSQAAVWVNHFISHDGAVAMTMPDVAFGVDIGHGWTAINNHSMRITKASETKLYELDGKSAIDTYTSLIHDQRIFTLFPLLSKEKNKYVTVLSIHDEAGYLQLSQPLNEGDLVNISTSSRAEVLDSTNNLASNGFVAIDDLNPEFVFFISSCSREWLLSEDPSAEYTKLLPFFLDQKLALIYLDGEFAPAKERTEHFNHSIVMATMYGADSDKLSDI